MKKYRVSGYIDEVGAVQLDITAENEAEAEMLVDAKYDFDEVISITEIE
jgi:hypothetical protein